MLDVSVHSTYSDAYMDYSNNAVNQPGCVPVKVPFRAIMFCYMALHSFLASATAPTNLTVLAKAFNTGSP